MHDNIVLFNRCVALILDALYRDFPVEQNIKCSDFDDFNDEEKSKIFFSTINFLKRENLISFSSQFYGGFAGVALTMKGLVHLQAVPKSLKEPFVSQIKKALKGGRDIVISKIIEQFISHIV